MVCLMFPWKVLGVRQKLKFSPRICLEPVGSCWLVHKLWNVKLDGCVYIFDGNAAIALLKFFLFE